MPIGLFRTKNDVEKSVVPVATLARRRFVQARGQLEEALLYAATQGGADEGWVENILPDMITETAEAWLDIHEDPTSSDIEDLWNDELRAFWTRSHWPGDVAIKDLAQEVSVGIHDEVRRQLGLSHGIDRDLDVSDSPEAELLGPMASWSTTDAEQTSEEASSHGVGVSRAIEIWRWVHADNLSDSARARLDRVAQIVNENSVGAKNIAGLAGCEVALERTESDLAHTREMIEFVARWVTDRPSEFETALGLFEHDGSANLRFAPDR